MRAHAFVKYTSLENNHLYIIIWGIYFLSLAKCDNGSVRLVSESGSSFRRYGRVEVCVQESWNTICSQYFNELVATVVCHQLGYSRYG